MIGQRGANFVQAGFLTAGTGVEYENFHRACTVSTGQAAPLTTRYEFEERKRSVNLCVSGTASTIRSAAVRSAIRKIRSACALISAGTCGDLVPPLSRIGFPSRSRHSSCDTFARTRPDGFLSTSTVVRRQRYLWA